MTEQTATPKQKAPKRRGKWRRRLFSIVFLAIVLVALAPMALALGPVRNWVANKVGEQIGRRVEIGSASAFWFKGIDLEDITVHSPEGFDRPLVTVKKVHADLDVLGLLSGKGGATVEITQPHLTLLRNAQGRGNGDGIVEKVQADSPAADSKPDGAAQQEPGRASKMHITLRVIDGRVESAAKPGETPRGIRDINISFEQMPDEPARLTMTGRLEAMSTSGGDVELRAATAMADGDSPFEFSLSEAVDLARLAPIVQGAAAVEGLRGSLQVDIKGKVGTDGRLDGKGTIKGAKIALNSPDGLQAYVGEIDLTTTFARVDAGTQAKTVGALRDVRLEQARAEGPPVSMTEPTIKIDVQALRSTDGNTITIDKALIAAGSMLDVQLTQPIELKLGDPWTATGQVGIRSDLSKLGALQSIVPQVSELRRGTLAAQIRAMTSDGLTRIGAGLRIDGLQLDPGELFEQGYAEPRVEAQLLVSQPKGAATQVEVRSLTLSGISSKGTFSLDESATNGSLTTTVDLAKARVLPAYLTLEPGSRLGGTVVATTRLVQEGESMRVSGDVQGTNISWTRPGVRPWSEPSLRVEHDVTLPGPAGSGTLHALRASLGSLSIDASGSTWASEPESHVDAKVVLSGQSERIVALLEMARGQAFEDLRASGPVSGTITVRGPATKAEALIAGTIDAGTWESGGFVLGGVRVTLDRPQPNAPLATNVRASLNGGTLALDTGLQLSARDEIPWNLKLDMKDVDTSQVLVSKGSGRYMSYLLPSLLPAGSQVPVMTGKLDVNANLTAQDVAGDLMTGTLQGTTTIHMDQGEIRNSTLFGGGGGSPQMQQLLNVLASVAPEVRTTVGSLSKALVFSSLDSRARIAQRVVHVEQLELAGPYVKIASKGTANFGNDAIAMQTNVELLGSAGKRVEKILPDRTIPLQVRGTLQSPQVTPRLDPSKLIQGGVVNEGKKLLEGLTGGDKGKKKNPLDRVKDLFGK